jgi:hypothetical protein
MGIMWRHLAAGALVTIAFTGCRPAVPLVSVDLAPSAAEAVQDSAQKAQSVAAYTAELTMDISKEGRRVTYFQGVMRHEQRQEPRSDITLSRVSYAGMNVLAGTRVIILGDTVYVRVDQIKSLLGTTKPWIRFDLRNLRSSIRGDIGRLFGQIRQIDLRTMAMLLTASRDTRAVAVEPVGGAKTTHYVGTFQVAQAIKLLPPESWPTLRDRLAGVQSVNFDVWIDAHGLPRKIQLNGAAGTVAYKTVMVFTSFNRAVNVRAPAANQVEEWPKRPQSGG